jgi:hypothetical protein
VVGEKSAVDFTQAPAGAAVPNAFNGLPKFFVVREVATISREKTSGV